MKNIWVSIILFLIIFICYIFFIPVNVYKKNIYQFDSYIDLNKNFEKNSNKIDGLFYSEKECGYFNFKDGLTSYITVNDDEFILANKFLYLIYTENENKIELFTPDKKLIKNFATSGYPMIAENLPYFYIITENGKSLSLYSINGNKLFNDLSFTSFITSISTDKNINSLVSTINGENFIFTKEGKKIFNKIFKDSKVNLTKSNVFDADGKYFALCNGLNPEFVEVYKNKNFKRILKIKTGTNFRFKNLMLISKDKIFYEGENCICYHNINNGKKGNYRFIGELGEVKVDKYDNLIVSSFKNDIYYLNIFSKNGEIIYYKEFNFPVNNISFIDDNTLFFKVSDELIKIRYG